MRKLLLFGVLIVIGLLVGNFIFSKPKVTMAAPPPKPAETIVKFSAEMESFIPAVAGSLGSGAGAFEQRLRELSTLQGTLRARLATAGKQQKAVIEQAQSLVAALQVATKERLENERVLARRIADPSRNLQGEIDTQAQDSFVQSHKNRWAARAKIWKEKLESLLAQLRAVEQAPAQ